MQWCKPYAEVVSSDDGSFIIEGLPEGTPFILAAISKDHAPAFTEAITTKSPPSRIVLGSAGTSVTGRVLDGDGVPVEGAIVKASCHDGDRMSRFVSEAVVTVYNHFTSTNKQGEFSLPLHHARWSMDINTTRGSASCSIALGDPLYLEIKLARVTSLTIRFIDDESGNGVPGVTLAPRASTSTPAIFSSGEDGLVAFTFVPKKCDSNWCSLNVSASLPLGWAFSKNKKREGGGEWSISSFSDFRVREGEPNELEVYLCKASLPAAHDPLRDGSVWGRLVDSRGMAVSGFVVGTSYRNDYVSTATDDDGVYLLEPVGSGQTSIDVQIPCNAPYADTDPLRVDVQPGVRIVLPDIVLAPAAVVTGALLDEDSDLPIADAEVRLCWEDGDCWETFPRTDRDGRFLARGSESVKGFWLQFLHPEYNDLRVDWTGSAQNITHRLKRMRKVFLKVRHHGSNTPVTRCLFDYHNPEIRHSEPSLGSTDANVIRCSAEGVYPLRLPAWESLFLIVTVQRDFGPFADESGYAQLYPNEIAEGSLIEITVSRGTLVGEVYLIGPALERISVSLRPRSAEGERSAAPLLTAETTNGQFEFHDIPNGAYEVVATAPGYATTDAAPLTVSKGRVSPRHMELRLERIVSIHGHVLGEDRNPAEGVMISAAIKNPQRKSSPAGIAISDQDGKYRIEGLTIGVYSLTADSGKKSIVREVRVDEEDVEFDLNLWYR